MAEPTVVFDLDGTLVDTAPDLLGTLDHVLAEYGIPPVPFAQARAMIGGGIKPLLERALQAQGRNLPPSEIDKVYAIYLDYYAPRLAEKSRPFPGLESALDALATQGFRLAVCTNKLEWLSVRLLEALGLAARFAAICGQDTFGVRKPDPEMLRRTLARAGGHPGRAVMVGDSATDIVTARAAGIPIVAVDFGYTDIPVAELGPDHIIGHFDELPAIVHRLIADTPANPASPSVND
jgi:phosphoglycolate phosphatase